MVIKDYSTSSMKKSSSNYSRESGNIEFLKPKIAYVFNSEKICFISSHTLDATYEVFMRLEELSSVEYRVPLLFSQLIVTHSCMSWNRNAIKLFTS